jgi:C4-dicarboxylate-specific signal transduction histidine kinase
MAAGLAHELNQPLAALKSYAQAAARMTDSGDARGAREAVTRIAAMADRAAAILQGIRGYIGGRGDQAEDIAPAISVREVIRLLENDPVRRAVTIDVDIEEDLPFVHAAPVQLQQVLVNVIRNACEATGPGGTVRLHAETGDGNLTITVDDDGPGLPDRPDLFTPFASEKPNGLGLGLAISKRIAEAHGGTLTGGTGPLGGARMTLKLPARASRRAAA